MADADRGLMRRFWRAEMRPHRAALVVAYVCMTIEGVMLGLLSYLIRPMFDDVFIPGDVSAVGWIAAAICGVFALRALAAFVQRRVVMGVTLGAVTSLQGRLVAHLLRLDSAFYHRNAPGALIERVQGDALTLQSALSEILMALGRDAVSILALLAVLFWIDWQWMLLTFAAVPVLALPIALAQRRVEGASRHARAEAGEMATRLDEMFHGIHAIKLYGLEEHESRRFSGLAARFRQQRKGAETWAAILPALIDIMAALAFLAVLFFGGLAIADGSKSVGEFMAFFTAMALIFDPLRRLSNVGGKLAMARASLGRMLGLFDTRPGILAPAAPVPVTDALRQGDVILDNVSFGYADTPVHDGLFIRARAGQVTALVGPSGAGKSTVFHLLARLVEPRSGQVSIGGVPVADLDPADLRRLFAVVSQDSALFDASIRDNIAMGNPDARPEEIARAADDAYVSDFARALPLGLDTPVGPRGTNLSGGQRQRVTIARAMLRDAPILLLDEPTSALDAESERVIRAALDRLSAGRTVLIIAHRLATVLGADQIVVMDRGRAVDAGIHAQLLARGGLYAELYRLQFAEG